MNALMLNCLENKGRVNLEESRTFDARVWDDLSADVHDGVKSSLCKAEYVFQCIQHLVVDAMEEHILVVPPPILTRSFQEMGAGMMIYHEPNSFHI